MADDPHDSWAIFMWFGKPCVILEKTVKWQRARQLDVVEYITSDGENYRCRIAVPL